MIQMIDIPIRGVKGELLAKCRVPQIENEDDLLSLFTCLHHNGAKEKIIDAINFGLRFTFASHARRKWCGIHTPRENETNLANQQRKESHE